jgi:two-component system phosphate regulon response regulator PhoB
MAKAMILVVEDDPDIRELIAYTLGKEGYETTQAPNGEDGLKAMAERKPDLVLLDVMLPGMDGLELLRRAKADKALRGIPVLMVSARGEEVDVVSGLELGADDYVTKPFSPRVLVARVRTSLRRSVDATAARDDRPGAIELGGLFLDPATRLASRESR